MLGQTRQIRLLSTLGEGGFGAVYLAEITGTDGFVQRAALKVLHQQMAGHGDIAGRQRDEARLLAQLNHDHIVKVLDLGDYDGRPAVMMEYVEGVDAHGLLQQGPLPARAVMEITAAVASALDAANTARSPNTGRPLNVVHRDIKPANILVTAQGGVKVLDFGVARADFDREGATRSVLFGTARFMAPEMWLDGRSGPAVDVYALGVTAWELLGAGSYARPPLLPDLYAKHVEDALATLRLDADPGWCADLNDLLRAMLAYEGGARPSAASVHDRALELAERAPGLALRRWARQAVPPILAERARCAVTPSISRPPPSTRFTPAGPPSGEAPARRAVPAAPGETTPVAPEPEPSAETPTPTPEEPARPAPTLAPLSEASPPAAPPPASPAPVAHARTTPAPRRVQALAGGLALAAVASALWWVVRPDPGPLSPEAPPEQVAPPLEPAPEEPVPEEPAPEEPAARTSQAEAAPSSPAAPAAKSAARARGSAEAAPTGTREPERAPPSTPALSCAAGPDRVLIDLSSSPLGAEVWAEGSRLGTTPLFDCGLPEGSLRVTMNFQGRSTTHQLRVAARAARSFVWEVEADRWVAGR